MAAQERLLSELTRVSEAARNGRLRSVVLLWEDGDGRLWEAVELQGHGDSFLRMIGQVAVTQSTMTRIYAERFISETPAPPPNQPPMVFRLVPKEPN
jgi:hypothetical protein